LRRSQGTAVTVWGLEPRALGYKRATTLP